MSSPAQPDSHLHELLAQARAAYNRNDALQATELALRLLGLDPDFPEAHYIAGLAAAKLRRMSQSLEHLHRAASLDPERAEYAAQFAKALVTTHRTGEALEIANVALSLSPQDPVTLDALSFVYMRANANERAAWTCRQAVALAPSNALSRFNLAVSLIFSGKAEEAEAELEACLTLAPDFWTAHGLLSRVRKQTPQRNHVDRLLSLSKRASAAPTAQMQIHVALGKEYEDLGDYSKAFENYTIGKSAMAAVLDHSSQRDEAIFEAMIKAFPESRQMAEGCPTAEPIFVMGMPRSGTTLVERILSSHPEVYSAGELENFGVALERLSRANSSVILSPDVIHRARTIPWRKLGNHYLLSTRPATSMKPHFIDKLPHNFLYAGFIANALPNAKMICLRRNPLDTCLSNFREPFSDATNFHGYSFNLLDAGRHYILFDRLMAHWKRVLPDRILEIQYETLVNHQDAVSRQLLAHCEVPWNDACLHFENNRTPATTASSLQVRVALNASAVGRWKNYESQLKPLKDLLNAAGIDCDQ